MPGALRILRSVIVSVAVILCAVALTQCAPSPITQADLFKISPYFIKCGGQGEACCKPPGTHPASLGPLVSCKVGLGCDVTTDRCVAPCGGTGQVCCDGPETRAPKWTADG